MNSWHVGDVKITRVVEIEAAGGPAEGVRLFGMHFNTPGVLLKDGDVYRIEPSTQDSSGENQR